MLARFWAGVLCDEFALAARSFVESYRAALQRWPLLVEDFAAQSESEGKLKWYHRQRLHEACYSTVATAEFREDSSAKLWAVGDSCIYHVADGLPDFAFPLNGPADFDEHPDLLSSNARGSREIREVVERDLRRESRRWRPGDKFYFATDALASFIASKLARSEPPWSELDDAARSDASYTTWVDEMRSRGLLESDDTTLMIVNFRYADEKSQK